MPSVLRLDNVTVRFGEKTVLDRFSMEVAAGERILLSGPSGSGKSTVLRAILGFVVPVEGEIFIDGDRATAESIWRLRRSMAYVPQHPDLGQETAAAWIDAAFQYRANHRKGFDRDRLAELMRRFSLTDDLLEKDATSLSGGEKQRFAFIAAALLDRPILLLDEPTSALDRANRDAIHRFLAEENGRTVVAISHEEPSSLEYADRVVHLAAVDGEEGEA